MCLTYLKLRTGRLDWSGSQVDAFLERFEETCAAAGTTAREALRNAALALEHSGRADFLPKLVPEG
jgi:hypothetical protein